MLAASTLAQAAAAVTIHGPAFLIPVLHDRRGLSLAEAGTVAAAPTLGVMLTLVVWGAVVDRRGERFVLIVGLAATAVTGVLSALAHSTALLALALFLAGAAAASTASASGRVVVGWFPPERRGLAMGIRQMAQPVGVGVGAISIAVIADRHGISTALWVPTLAALGALVITAAVVLDPPRPARTETTHVANPYRTDAFLARIHGVSVLLVVPQFLVWTFALVWLTDDRDWSSAAAGALVGASQVVGALGRIAAGQLSDVVRSRLRPLRWVAVAAALSMGALGLTAHLDWGIAVALMVLATTVTVADNGLAFTAVAERAGPFWSGRALGAQNTAQYLAASAVPPIAGLVVAQWGYAATFAVAALFPLVAVALVPVRDERALT
jgi:sugar phosphate permease